MPVKSKLHSLLNSITPADPADHAKLVKHILKPRSTARELAQQELIEIVKLGYWPVHFASDQRHWIAQGETLDDSGCPGHEDDEIFGYEHTCYITQDVAFYLSLVQGNTLDVDGETQLRFTCWNLDQGANILRQEYSITGLDQVTKIIDRDWAKFVAQAWPDVCKAIETSQQQSQAQAHLASNPRDQNIFNDLETFVWDRFNQDLRQDLEHCVFRDYSTLDTLQAWIQNSTKLSCTPEY